MSPKLAPRPCPAPPHDSRRQSESLDPECEPAALAGAPGPGCGAARAGDEELFLQQLARRARLLDAAFRARVLRLIESRAAPRRAGSAELQGGGGAASLRRRRGGQVRVVECCFDDGSTWPVEVLDRPCSERVRERRAMPVACLFRVFGLRPVICSVHPLVHTLVQPSTFLFIFIFTSPWPI
jgi:hypothetical protein